MVLEVGLMQVSANYVNGTVFEWGSRVLQLHGHSLDCVWSGLKGGFTLRPKIKETSKLNNPIGRESNFEHDDITLGFGSKAWKMKWH